MTDAAIIARLLDEHQQLRTICAELSAMLAQPKPPAGEMLSDCRWRIARLMLRHLPLEERFLFRRLREHPQAEVAAKAIRFQQELDPLYELFRQHTERWTEASAVAEWDLYRLSARERIAALEDRMKREETELYPLLDSAPQLPTDRSPDDRNWAADGWLVRQSLGLG